MQSWRNIERSITGKRRTTVSVSVRANWEDGLGVWTCRDTVSVTTSNGRGGLKGRWDIVDFGPVVETVSPTSPSLHPLRD